MSLDRTEDPWIGVFNCQEVLAIICSYLLPIEIAKSKCVCRRWNKCLNNSLSFNRVIIFDFPMKDKNDFHFARNRGNPRFLEYLYSVCNHSCYLQHIELILGGKETCCLNKLLTTCQLKNLKSFKLRFVYDQYYLINYGTSFTPTPKTKQEKHILRYFRQYPRLSPRTVLDNLCCVLANCTFLEVLHLGRECPLTDDISPTVTSSTSLKTTGTPYTYDLHSLQHLSYLRELRIDGWDNNGSILRIIPKLCSLRIFVWTSKSFDTVVWNEELHKEDKIIVSNTLQLIDLRGLEDGHFITSIGHCPQLKQLLLRSDCGLIKGGSSMIFSSFMMKNQHIKKFIRTSNFNNSSNSGSGSSSNSSSNIYSNTRHSLYGSGHYCIKESKSEVYTYSYLLPPYNIQDNLQTPIITSVSGQQRVGGIYEGLFPVVDKLVDDGLYGARYCTLPNVNNNECVLVFSKLDLLTVCPQARIRQFVSS